MLFKIAFLIASTAFLGGCASYKLGSMLPSDIQTVHMSTIVNETNEPLIENDITNAIFSELRRDGSIQVAPEASADALMVVRVYDYNLLPLSYSSDNRSLPDEYRLILTAEVELIQRTTGKSLVRDDKVQGESDFPLTGDLTQAKRVGLPGAANDLARFVVSAVTEAWVE